MRIRFRQGIRLLWCLAFLLLLAACAPAGGSTANSPQANQATATTTPSQASTTATPAPKPTPGGQALNGCSTTQPPADAQQPADVVVTEGGQQDTQAVALKKGQTLEVRLQANTRWRLNVQDAGSILSTTEATGWYDATLKVCRWRFTAEGTGGATLSFVGIVLCAPNLHCPVAAIVQQYDVTAR